MIVVIIAGGSGSRLWPLSTPDYPKHLLKINGDEESLLQKTYNRAQTISQKIYIVTDGSHAHHVRKQLPGLDDSACIVEPARRGTASCILAALARVHSAHGDDEPIAFLAADHYIRDTQGFARSFEIAGQVSGQTNRIVLVGVEPDYAATGFGYIKKGDLLEKNSFVFNVDSFKEKPSREVAQEYLKSGQYLWNCGYFVGSVKAFKTAMQASAIELHNNYEKLTAASAEDFEHVYLSFESISIDYALIEKTKNLLVEPASFDWMDLGSYGDLHKAAGSDAQGNHVTGRVELEGVENSFVQNYEDKPLALVGLDNVAVINTKDGILVTRKDLAQKVGDVSKRIK